MDKAAGSLIYLADTSSGHTRRGQPGNFVFETSGGKLIKSQTQLKRIEALVIPPAWTDVWIAPAANAHLQVTGRDAKGRKQYIYHPAFREEQEQNKFEHMLDFVAALPKIRARVAADMRKPGLPREKILASVVFLLQTTLIRVGNSSYAKENKSYGLTTLRSRHAKIEGAAIKFTFKGKSGKDWRLKLKDRRLANIVRMAQELPGQHLFQYLDDEGKPQAISSGDINCYLRGASGQDVTAKDFRTWAGSILAAQELAKLGGADSETKAKRNLRAAILAVSNSLGNTPAVCRKCYVHPAISEAYLNREEGPSFTISSRKARRTGANTLSEEEAAVARFLRRKRQLKTAPPAKAAKSEGARRVSAGV